VRLDRRAATTVVCAVAGTVILSSAQQPPLPTFRSGVRLVEVDVVVQDREDRFVDTLTKDDFEVLEDGQPQEIQALWVVNLPVEQTRKPPREPPRAAPFFVDAVPVLPAAGGAAADVGRLYVLVLDSGSGDRVRTIGRQFITEFLGPTDLMAVVHVHDRSATQGLSANPELLLQSVDRYRGGAPCSPSSMNDAAGCPGLQMLKEVAVNLSATTGRRKAVMFIGTGWGMWALPAVTGGGGSGARVDYGAGVIKLVRAFEEMVKTARRNNVRIYPVSPEGFQASIGDMTGQSTGPSVSSLSSGGVEGDAAASLRILAADTGGIAIANTNNYGGNFPHIVRDLSAYYILTYNSTAEADGRAHPIAVRLRNRLDLSLRAGRTSVTAPTPDVKGRSVRLPRDLSREARSALAASTPVAGPPLELFTAVFQGSNYDGSILIGTHVPGALVRLAPKDKIEVSYAAVDRWGAVRAAERRAFTLNLGAQSRARVEQTGLRLFGRLQVPRGHYQVRVVAHQAQGTTAAASTGVEVADYADQPLSVSDFIVASARGPKLLTLEQDVVLRSALPAQPTPARRFGRDDTLTVFAEIYDSHWILSQEVGVTLTVTGEHGRLVFRGEQVLTTANKGRFYLTATVPLGPFAPGDYALAVEAHTRRGIPANASQQMRFAVEDEAAPPVAGGTTR
jgi:VWFA-related protein